MTSLITILIALLGYGTPSDYEGYTEDQLQQEITIAEEEANAESGDDGVGSDWDQPGVIGEDPQP